jgi:hypothetical protein
VYAGWGCELILRARGWQPEWNPAFMPRRGFGDAAQEAAQLTSIGGSVAGSTVGVLGSTGAIAASTASLAIPLIGAGVAAVIGAIAIIKNSGCGQTCIITANDANKIEPYLQANLKGYFDGPRTVASQQAALANFDYFWSYLQQACGNPQLGNAGKRCITDRQAGACVWRQTVSSDIPGAVQPGECWNWFSGYRDPIANDPDVKQSISLDSLIGGGSVHDAFGAALASGGFSWSQLFIPALLLVALWVVS